MQVGRLQIQPVFSCHDMSDGVRRVSVQHHLRVAHSARGKVDHHWFIAARRLAPQTGCS